MGIQLVKLHSNAILRIFPFKRWSLQKADRINCSAGDQFIPL